MPLIRDQQWDRPESIHFHFEQQSAASDQRYKLVHNRSTSRQKSDNGVTPFAEWELYDLLNDPTESKNLASESPEFVERLRKGLQDWEQACQHSNEGGDYPQ